MTDLMKRYEAETGCTFTGKTLTLGVNHYVQGDLIIDKNAGSGGDRYFIHPRDKRIANPKNSKSGHFIRMYQVDPSTVCNLDLVKLQAENAKLKAQLTWRPVTQKPEKGQTVLATYMNRYGKRRRVRAVYIRQYEEEVYDDCEAGYEYSEEHDLWYLKEGWYELIDNWDDYTSVAIVEGTVDHWLPLPPAPEGEVK